MATSGKQPYKPLASVVIGNAVSSSSSSSSNGSTAPSIEAQVRMLLFPDKTDPMLIHEIPELPALLAEEAPFSVCNFLNTSPSA
jgi:hypothetical protein